MENREGRAKSAMAACSEAIKRRKFCYTQSNEGKQGEECVREELEEKRCMAELLCPAEFKAFYHAQSSKGICALWAEAFFFAAARDEPPHSREEHVEGKRHVDASSQRTQVCRDASHALTLCLAKYSPYTAADDSAPS
mmetsp:Transcript_26878/g.63858  ORF Transcript_26878/g.63858 Transcript_26878/m.63858 type:complete len:138 (-) Transcript_26878:16-429(-)